MRRQVAKALVTSLAIVEAFDVVKGLWSRIASLLGDRDVERAEAAKLYDDLRSRHPEVTRYFEKCAMLESEAMRRGDAPRGDGDDGPKAEIEQ